MNEAFLHYIWKQNLYFSNKLYDTKGNKIEVIDKGTHNFDAGPDFFNAKIKLNNTIWVGNAEIHKSSSDWKKHGHHKDPAYDNVILQLVAENDLIVHNSKGEEILTAIMNFDNTLIEAYENLNHSRDEIPCNDFIRDVDKLSLNSWLTSLLIERIEQKTEYLKSVLEYTNNNWEESFYIILARSFGFKVNAEPFELLAKSLPSIILSKNRSDLMKIEAILFGQAGFFNVRSDQYSDVYFNSLKKEYLHQKNKYKLNAVDNHLWKFLRIRPVNFPTVRIAQFAQLVFRSSHLFSKVLESKEIMDILSLFDLQASIYWNTHYKFGSRSKEKVKKFGKTAAENLIINSVIPVLFLYGKEKDNADLKNKALRFLEQLKAENNRITKKWISLGTDVKNAYFSQSLIQLYNEYCLKKRCLNCRIGNSYIIKNRV